MSRSTRATIDLAKAGIAFTTHAYDYAPGDGRVGLQAADALGESPSRVLKTLMIEIDGAPACAIIASDRELALKKVAAAFGGKAARMMPPAQAERLTGYHVGGISPVRPEEARADRDRGGGAGRALCVHQWRPARIAGAARSEGCRARAEGRDRVGFDLKYSPLILRCHFDKLGLYAG